MTMISRFLFTVTFVTALGCGLIAGLFFAFSVAVMQALARLPAASGMSAMQAINSAILNPLFLAVFLGTGVGAVLVMVTALLHWQSPSSVYFIIGGTLYLVGSLGVTIVCNVPKNDALASVAPAHPDSAGLWDSYVRRWTAWNHVRTVAALAAEAALLLGLWYRG